MLTFPKVFARSLLIVAAAILADALASSLATVYGISFIEIMGDMMLIEVAILFLIAGVIDFSTSVGAAHLRKALFGSESEYSSSAHKESGRRALVLVLAGIVMFALLIAVAILSAFQ